MIDLLENGYPISVSDIPNLYRVPLHLLDAWRRGCDARMDREYRQFGDLIYATINARFFSRPVARKRIGAPAENGLERMMEQAEMIAYGNYH